MPNVEVSPNFRCPGGHCLGLCRPLGSNDGAMGSSFGPLQHGAQAGASFWVRFSEVGGNFWLRAASKWRYGQGAILIDILCLMDSRSFVGRFPVSPKHWPGPVAHLRVSLSSSSRKFFKMCHEIVHVKIRILYSIPPINSITIYQKRVAFFKAIRGCTCMCNQLYWNSDSGGANLQKTT